MNLRDVAKKARVGSATVSRVLNDHPDVKSSTRARVLRAIEELKYRPNLHARTLAGGKTRVLGVVMVNLYNPFFTDICVAMERNAVLEAETGETPPSMRRWIVPKLKANARP